ncbi:MAG: DnaJ domain-containing protein [Thermodesulfobacteriota bacterium]
MTQPAQELAAAYARLGLAFGADAAAVKAAFRRLAPRLHPDRNPAAPADGMAALNAAYALILRHLAQRPAGVRAYRYDLWAPRTGQREFSFDTWAAPSQQGDYRFETFADQPPPPPRPRPRRGASPTPTPPAGPEPLTGLGPLAAPAPPPPPPDLAPARPRETPPPAPAWRLTGLAREGQALVYRLEVGGRPDHVMVPVRWRRPCPACLGRGRGADGRGPCPACAGRGGIVAARLVRVELPSAWRSGERLPLPLAAPEPGGGLFLELARPGQEA